MAGRYLREIQFARERGDALFMLGKAVGVHEHHGNRLDAVGFCALKGCARGREIRFALDSAISAHPFVDFDNALVKHVGFDDLALEYNGDRTLTFKFAKGENVKLYDLHMDIPLFKDVWRAGEYQAGDEVVRDGSMWIALKKTETMPGAPNSDWRLCTKRGRDGKDGKQGPEGPSGKAGRDGRDLTQMGPEGSKW